MLEFFKRKKPGSGKSGSTATYGNHGEKSASPATGFRESEDADELIAVIAAAVASSMNRSTHDIVVRSIRRIPAGSPVWNQAARYDLTAGF